MVIHLRWYDTWSEEDGWEGIPYYAPRFSIVVVRSAAIPCMPHDRLDITVITTSTDHRPQVYC